MPVDQAKFRQTAAGNLTRYRVGGATQLIVQENFSMTVAPGFIVAAGALLVVRGLLIVRG